MRYAAEAAQVREAIVLGGALNVSIAGVRLRIDRWTDEFYIEVSEVFDPATLRGMSEWIERLGYEVMPEWECPPQELEDGTIRHWLVEKEVVHDSSDTLEAI